MNAGIMIGPPLGALAAIFELVLGPAAFTR